MAGAQGFPRETGPPESDVSDKNNMGPVLLYRAAAPGVTRAEAMAAKPFFPFWGGGMGGAAPRRRGKRKRGSGAARAPNSPKMQKKSAAANDAVTKK